jgi:GT2 family glycosyltransferase
VDVTILIATRNTRELTERALASIAASQDVPAKEVIVVDNGSTDDTGAVIKEKYPGVKLIRAERNLGFARAINLGAQSTRGEFLLLLNSDTVLPPEALAAVIAWMRGHPECGVAGVRLLNPDGSPQNSIANFPTLATELLNKSLLRRLFPRRFPGKEQRLDQPVEVESVVGAFMLIRRAAWDALGGLDERYFFFLEETDFCLHARRAGWRVMHLPQIAVWHGQGQTAKKAGAGARIEYWRSRYLYFAKNHGPGQQAVLAAGLCLRLLVDWLASGCLLGLTLGRSERWKNKWQAYSALWRWHWRGRPQGMGLPR